MSKTYYSSGINIIYFRHLINYFKKKLAGRARKLLMRSKLKNNTHSLAPFRIYLTAVLILRQRVHCKRFLSFNF